MNYNSCFDLTDFELTHCYIAKASKDKPADQPEKKTRKKKDADAPKKPMSAFFWYQQHRRNAIKEDKPNLVWKEVIVVSITYLQN